MPRLLAASLQQVIDQEMLELQLVSEAQASLKPSRGGWSRKEELGHLIDSATNNHVRFVLASLEPEFTGPGYQQDRWVTLHGYQDLAWSVLIDFWYRYNQLLVHLASRIEDARLSTPCSIASGAPVTLGFVIEDYILHMRHHLDHILEREQITQYPGAAMAI